MKNFIKAISKVYKVANFVLRRLRHCEQGRGSGSVQGSGSATLENGTDMTGSRIRIRKRLRIRNTEKHI